MSTRPRRHAPASTRPDLRVVRGKGPRRVSLVPAAVILVLAVFGVAALQAYLGQEGLRMNQLERQVQEAEEEHALLRARVAELSSPARLEEAAAELGMVRAPDPVFLREPFPLPERSTEDGYAYSTKRHLNGVP